MVVDQIDEGPITDICIVSDKSRCPQDYTVIAKAFDDPTSEADVWKDGFFAFSRILRFICISRRPAKDAFVCNVVADIAILNEKDLIPAGFTSIDFTADTREKALRKKQLCIRTMPRDSAVDAVSNIILLTKQKKPPTGYSLAGEIDGVVLCYKYGTIPGDFPGAAYNAGVNVYPHLPYPIHPMKHSSSNPTAISGEPTGHQRQSVSILGNMSTLDRQYSIIDGAKLGIDGVPFEMHHLLKDNRNSNSQGLPSIRQTSAENLESEYSYDFNIEQTFLSTVNW